jgi:hypothetical protein
MNITPRTCANCTAYDPTDADGYTCGNGVGITELRPGHPDVHRSPSADDCCDDHQTAKEAATERHLKEATPEFLEAMRKCLRLHETLGIEHPEAHKAFMLAIHLAPQSLHDEVGQMAIDMDLMPAPCGYTLDGEPAFSLESVAAKIGVSMEEAESHMHDMLAIHDELGLPAVLLDPATIHRVQ